ncbi:Acetylglutamate kinase [Buchnera aphidicola (Tetraneura ulmi)]|uniref:acetylglutamate kinase n=1 Tax=Buchnera aphidicola TaxID=9 RepID=UPI0034644823
MKDNPLVIKLGGVLLDSRDSMKIFFDFLSTYFHNYSRNLIIVHGGGKIIDDMMKKIGMNINKINGIRVTNSSNIDIVVGALAGIANKRILSYLKRNKINFIGVSLSDGDSVLVERSKKLDFKNHTGIPKSGNPKLLFDLLSKKILPVVSSIGITKYGELMNVNADLAASALAKTLGADLILLSDVSSVLDKRGNRIDSINREKFNALINDGTIKNGMIVKVQAALDASEVLGKSVQIASWKENNEKLKLLFNGELSVGTFVYK